MENKIKKFEAWLFILSEANQSLDVRELSPDGIIFCNRGVGSHSLKLWLKQTCDSPLNFFYSNNVSMLMKHRAWDAEGKKGKEDMFGAGFICLMALRYPKDMGLRVHISFPL